MRTGSDRALRTSGAVALGVAAVLGAGACAPAVEPTAAPPSSAATSAAPPSAPRPTGPTTTAEPAPLPRSMKGWELYSWPVDGEWHFTIAVGTNRSKTLDELVTQSDLGLAGMVDVVGVDAAVSALGRLPAGAGIVWFGGRSEQLPGMAIPPADIVDTVRRRSPHIQVLVAGSH